MLLWVLFIIISHRGSETRPTGPPSRYPIVFIHGNSDIGMGNGGSVGW